MRLVCFVLLASWFCAGGAHAQITLNGQPLEGKTVEGTITVRQESCTNPLPWYFWLNRQDGQTINIDYTCPAEATLDTRTLPDGAHYIHARNDQGTRWQSSFTVRNTVSAPAPPSTYASVAPPCFPTKFNYKRLDLQQGVYTPGYRFSFTWVCNPPEGYHTYTVLTKDSELGEVADYATQYLLKKLSLVQATALIEERLEPLTQAEFDYIGVTNAIYKPKAAVSLYSGRASRPVYTKSPDGSRNTTAVVGARVAVGAQCAVGNRIVGTSYYSVQGNENVDTPAIDTLPELYAPCTVTLPIGSN